MAVSAARSAAWASFTDAGKRPEPGERKEPSARRRERRGRRPPPTRGTAPGAASHATAPSTIAITRSAAGRQRSSRCSATTTAVPQSSFRRRSCQTSSSPATGSSCEVGSSSTSSGGSCTIAAAIATRWSSPPESVSVRRSSRCATPRPSAVSSTARATVAAGSPRCSSGSSSSARTPPITICVSGSWKTVPHTAASSPGPCSRTSRPPTLSSPRRLAAVEVRHEPAERAQQRGLAGARHSREHGERARLELERQLAQRRPRRPPDSGS